MNPATGADRVDAVGASKRRDDETARLLLAVLWRLKAHLHGETPLTGSNDR